MATVWVVEQGEYSDYRVVGVFTTEARAKAVADMVNGPERAYDASVSEWPLDPGSEDLEMGRSMYLVRMLRDGTIDCCVSRRRHRPSVLKTISGSGG